MAKVGKNQIIQILTLEEGNEIFYLWGKGKYKEFSSKFKNVSKGTLLRLYKTAKKNSFKCQCCGKEFTNWALINTKYGKLIRLVRENGVDRKGNKKYTYGTLDHIIPKVKGGPNTLWNLDLTCRGCNIEKGNHMPPLEKQLIVQIDKILYEMEINKN